MVEKFTANDQCESEETESDQPTPIIPTASVCFQAIESIRQLMQTYDDDQAKDFDDISFF